MAKFEPKPPTKVSDPVPPQTKVDAHPPTPPAAARVAVHAKRDPLKVVGLETALAGEYRYLEDATEVGASGAFEPSTDADGKATVVHARTIAVGGKHYEHTTEDADGVWIYREM